MCQETTRSRLPPRTCRTAGLPRLVRAALLTSRLALEDRPSGVRQHWTHANSTQLKYYVRSYSHYQHCAPSRRHAFTDCPFLQSAPCLHRPSRLVCIGVCVFLKLLGPIPRPPRSAALPRPPTRRRSHVIALGRPMPVRRGRRYCGMHASRYCGMHASRYCGMHA